MGEEKVVGGPGITSGGDTVIRDVEGQVAVGSGITQTQILSTLDKRLLLESLIEFKKETAKLGLPEDDQEIVNGQVAAAVKEARKEEPNPTEIKGSLENAVETIKENGKEFVEKVSKWEWTKRILKILGKFGLKLALGV